MKQKKMLSVLAAVALVFLVAASLKVPSTTKMAKQTGGSTGDSVTAAADTATAVFINEKATVMYTVAACDSNMVYTTQVSPDNSHWFTVDTDTVTAGGIEASADFGTLYAGMYVRTITDMIPSGGADFGGSWLILK